MPLDRSRTRELLLDSGGVLAIAVATALLSQRWTSLLLDSMFYASEALFGHDVTDRAVIPSYYSNRLGYIAPVHLYTRVLGTWPGFEAWRLTLIIVITAGLFIICRRFTSRIPALLITWPLVLSTVVLTYVANTYVTGTVMALTVTVIASTLFSGWRAYLIAGVALGWLAMTHPIGLLLAGSLWVALRIHEGFRWRGVLVAGVSALATFLVFLGVGRIMFPDIGWFATYLKWNAQMNYSDFASREPIWPHDVSLIAIAVIVVVVIGAWLMHRQERWAQLAVITVLTGVGFMLVFSPMQGGVPLEAPMYQANVWPPALAALAMLASGRIGREPDRAPVRVAVLITGGIAVVATFAAGHWDGVMDLSLGWVLGVIVIALAIAALAWARSQDATRIVVVTMLVLALIATAAQLLQNGRRTLGLYPHTPYAYAFVPSGATEKMHEAVNAQKWLLAHTTSDDQILNWVGQDWVAGERDLFMVAAMQLWGENRVTLEPQLTPPDAQRLADLKPTVVQMVAPTMDQVITFWSSLPGSTHPTPPECYDFPWPGPMITQGHQCLTRLTWPSP